MVSLPLGYLGRTGGTAMPIIKRGGVIPWSRVLELIDNNSLNSFLYNLLRKYNIIYFALEPAPAFLLYKNNIVNKIIIGTNDIIIEDDIFFNDEVEYIINKPLWLKVCRVNINNLINIYNSIIKIIKNKVFIKNIIINSIKIDINNINDFLLNNIKIKNKYLINLIKINNVISKQYDYILINHHRIVRGILEHSEQETLDNYLKYIENLISNPSCIVISIIVFKNNLVIPNIIYCNNSIYIFYLEFDNVINKEVFSSSVYLSCR